MNTAELEFNIIYTPDTARYLAPLALTLLEYSDCRYRLIANGCDADERAWLEKFCERDERLSYRCISEDGMIEHGDALNILQAEHDGEWFCAMDSDILASGDFTEQLAGFSKDYDLMSSCLPVWCVDSDTVLKTGFGRLQGTHVELECGIRIGCTYFIVYNNAVINEIRRTTGIGFERYYWEDLPAEHQQIIEKLGVRKTDYDTAIVMTLLLTDQGKRISYVDLPSLLHLGGISLAERNISRQLVRGRVDRVAVRLRNTPLGRLVLKYGDFYYGNRYIVEDVSQRERLDLASRARRRGVASQYFYTLLHALVDGHHLPKLPFVGNKAVEDSLQFTSDKVTELYRQPGIID